MAEREWNNNGDAIDAALNDAGVRPAQARDERPVATGPFPPSPLMQLVTALELRVARLETTRGDPDVEG
jgi:hypothetical protein